jgi:hypothetical protein
MGLRRLALDVMEMLTTVPLFPALMSSSNEVTALRAIETHMGSTLNMF